MAPSDSICRVQRNPRVRAVQRLAAPVGLDIHRVASDDKRGDIGDRVIDPVTAGVAFEEHRLIQIHRLRRVDRDQWNIGAIQIRQARIGSGFCGCGFYFRWKFQRQFELALDSGKALLENRVIG